MKGLWVGLWVDLCFGLYGPVGFAGPLDVVVDDVGEQLFGRLAEEGHAADEELVEDDPRRPPIHRFTYFFSSK